MRHGSKLVLGRSSLHCCYSCCKYCWHLLFAAATSLLCHIIAPIILKDLPHTFNGDAVEEASQTHEGQDGDGDGDSRVTVLVVLLQMTQHGCIQ